MHGIERLEEVAKELSIIRQQVRQVAYQAPIDSDAEWKLISSKGKVARNLQPLIAELGNPQYLRSNLIKSMRQIVSLRQLSQMANMELRTIEKELHRQQLQLYKWLGELQA